MKKHIFLILLLFAMPVFLHSISEENVTIAKFSMEPVPFNERRDSVADSPYNAFDGDTKSAALYSNFTIEFNKPVTIDQLKIMNGNASNEDIFKRSNRERDIEITLYTVAITSEKKIPGKKSKRIEKAEPEKTEDKKIPINDKEEKSGVSKDKVVPDKTKNDVIEKGKIKKDSEDKEKINEKKTDKDIIKKDKTEIENQEKEKPKKEIKKTDLPEKVVNEYLQDDVKLYFTSSENLEEPEKKTEEKTSEKISEKSDKNPELKKEIKPLKSEEKKTKKKPEKNVKEVPEKKDTEVKKKKEKAKPVQEKKPVKEKVTGKNIIEIIDSKKDKKNTDTKKQGTDKEINKKTNKEVKKEDSKEDNKEKKSETDNNEIDATEIKKSLAPENKTKKIESSKSSKNAVPAKKKKNEKNLSKKTTVKDKGKDKKSDKDKSKKIKSDKVENKKSKIEIIDNKEKKDKKDQSKKENTERKKSDNNIIEITDSKDKKQKDKTPAADKKISEDKKIEKPETKKKESKNSSAEKIKKIESDKPDAEKQKIVNKDKTKDKKPLEEKIHVEDVKVKKMTGIVRIENDTDGRVLVYTTLKDLMDFQTIDLKNKYAVKKIDFRTRDDEYYTGTETDRSGITEIAFFNKGKKIPIKGIDALKKSYSLRYNKTLVDSLSDQTFIMYENNDIALRMTFNKDGSMNFSDRFKCSKKGGPDCTSISMPDKWKVSEGKLYMRYHTLWRVWKYQLDSQSDMLDETKEQSEPPRWLKIYFKSENGFTDKYLDLVRSEKGVWAE